MDILKKLPVIFLKSNLIDQKEPSYKGMHMYASFIQCSYNSFKMTEVYEWRKSGVCQRLRRNNGTVVGGTRLSYRRAGCRVCVALELWTPGIPCKLGAHPTG